MAGDVVVIGTSDLVAGFGLAGAGVRPADDPASVLAAWRDLPSSVAVVVLTEAAASALGEARHHPDAPLTVVLPR
ncbi:V-type ATP synthase subunit F [Nocardioides ungokensis]|uniref:V-type ATP synthase subunit F n=1 Tax=Nocardioides ungokensis TaxID=1643322 RepID=UPI0015DF65CC|nr:V-type ATP synthase subunit F [Nocardioides ungokensis]